MNFSSANACDTGLLAYCAYLCLSRSGKIVDLLKREIKLYRLHVSKLKTCMIIIVRLPKLERNIWIEFDQKITINVAT